MLTVLTVLAGSAATGQSPPDAPVWMAGCWEQAVGDKWTEECWMGPRGGIMLGAARSGRGSLLRNWESTQIVMDHRGGPVFWASPNGAARANFPMVSQGPKEIVFANPAHDYPQRIRYWQEGEMLKAEISLIDGSKAMRWTYRRTR